MSTALFTVGWDGDAEFFSFLCCSIRKFATGFGQHTIVFDPAQAYMLDVANQYPEVRQVHVPEREPGHAHQMAIKLQADQFVGPCDAIIFMDCDTHFSSPVTPADFFVNGKPRLVFMDWEAVEKKYHHIPWRAGTSALLGWRVDKETMRSSSVIYLPQTVRATREHIEGRYRQPIGDVMAGPDAWDYHPAQSWFPRQPLSGKPRASEFNLLGNFALRHHYDGYYLHDLERENYNGGPVRQFWSHAGVTAEIREYFDRLLPRA